MHDEPNNTETVRIYVEMKTRVDQKCEATAARGSRSHLDDELWDVMTLLKTCSDEDQARKWNQNDRDERGVCTPLTSQQRRNVDVMREVNVIMSLVSCNECFAVGTLSVSRHGHKFLFFTNESCECP